MKGGDKPMKCRKCGTENPPKARECMKCGQSLLPPLPKEALPNKENTAKLASEIPGHSFKPKSLTNVFAYGLALMLVLSVVILFAGVAVMTSGINEPYIVSYTDHSDLNSAEISKDSVEEKAKSTQEAEGEADDIETDDPLQNEFDEKFEYYDAKANRLKLPQTDIVLGMPEDIVYASESGFAEGNPASFTTRNHVSITITMSSTTSIPFTKSEEEEYFKEQYNYARIEGTDTQYFYVQYPDEFTIRATIVDHASNRFAQIDVSSESMENLRMDARAMNQCYTVMNEMILDQSSIVQKAKAQQ